MPRTLNVRKPTRAEFRRPNQLIEEAATPQQQRKAHALVLHYVGMTARDIATTLGVHPNTIYADLQAFQQRGPASLQPSEPWSAPARINPRQAEQARRIGETPPGVLGVPYGHWSLPRCRPI